MKRDFKLVAFDLDGTLINSITDLATAAECIACTHKSCNVTDEIAKACIGNGLSLFLSRIYAHFDIHTDSFEDELRNFEEYYFAHCVEKTSLCGGVSVLLTSLYKIGVALAVITMKPRKPTDLILDSLGISDYFQEIIAGDEMLRPKPDPYSILLLCDKYRINTNDVLVVGDGMTDVDMALNSGAYCAAILTGYGNKAELSGSRADVKIDDISQIISLFE